MKRIKIKPGRPTLRDLTPKQRKFLLEYLQSGNGAAAARTAGYSSRTASAIASENLTKLKIQKVLNAELEKTQFTLNHVLARLSEMANANIADFVTVRGKIRWAAVRSRGYLIKRLKVGPTGTCKLIEMCDAQAALTVMGKHLGLFHDQVSAVDSRQVRLMRLVLGNDPKRC
jgi:phage terminase small subunit